MARDMFDSLIPHVRIYRKRVKGAHAGGLVRYLKDTQAIAEGMRIEHHDVDALWRAGSL